MILTYNLVNEEVLRSKWQVYQLVRHERYQNLGGLNKEVHLFQKKLNINETGQFYL